MTEPEETQGMNIGALSKATGVPVETLRTWERRYGFPDPTRDAQGHRVYDMKLVGHVRMVDAAIRAGHRASSAVALDLATLEATYGEFAATGPSDISLHRPANQAILPWLEATMKYDGETLEDLFRRDWASLGAMEFLKVRITPFLQEIGIAWAERRLEIGHEHFASERVRDFLTTLWRPLSDRSRGPRVVCATLPGESHYLGLQMAATVLSIAGCRVIYLGSDTPVPDIVTAASAFNTAAVCVSVSIAANKFMAMRDVATLRDTLPSTTALILGGRGAPEGIPHTRVFSELDGILAWGQSMMDSHPTAGQ